MSLPLIKQALSRLAAIEANDVATRFIMLSADYTLTSTTSQQKLFNTTTNGALTIPTGVYSFRAGLYVDTMSATSGNLSFGLKGAGTATLANVLYHTVGKDSATATNPNALSGIVSNTALSSGQIFSAAVNAQADGMVAGIFEISAAGTIIPSVALITAAAAVAKQGTFFLCTRLGPTGTYYAGSWS